VLLSAKILSPRDDLLGPKGRNNKAQGGSPGVAISPHPRPLSRLGERGAEGGVWAPRNQGFRPGLSYFAASRLRCCSGMPAEPASPAALWLRPSGAGPRCVTRLWRRKAADHVFHLRWSLDVAQAAQLFLHFLFRGIIAL
jgi:hypothetical protein